ncbi:MAG: hypothetical protein QNJ46_21585 [Leptolyngbyaceae cyanobacterium MO_188.B28]|nr:hypothetical protein [Leptolyngbyaceae cyanobacterium MO_188.B28]
MVDSVLSKLLAADSDLEAQEARLLAQLDALQAKRSSLKSVMGIIGPDQPTAEDNEADVAPTQISDAESVQPIEKPAKGASRRKAKATTDKPTQSRKTSSRSKSHRRGWQKYMRDEYLQMPLPKAVAGILKSKPKKTFEIQEVVNTIVEEDIPASDRKGARNRISNILAEGARKKEWSRPKDGCYRFSK